MTQSARNRHSDLPIVGLTLDPNVAGILAVNGTMFPDEGLEAIGFFALRQKRPDLTGKGVRLLQVEYKDDAGAWAVPDASYLPNGATPLISYHATKVAEVHRIIAPEIALWSIAVPPYEFTLTNPPLMDNGVYGSPTWNALPAEWDVENHSYTYDYTMINRNLAKTQDGRLVRDDVVSVAACGNSLAEVDYVWNGSFRTCMAGAQATPNGTHPVWDGTTQAYPDLRVPTQWSSIASPVIAACVALLIQAFPNRRQEIIPAMLKTAVNKMLRVDSAYDLLSGAVVEPTPEDPVPPPTSVLAAPTNLRAVDLKPTSFLVRWDQEPYANGINRWEAYGANGYRFQTIEYRYGPRVVISRAYGTGPKKQWIKIKAIGNDGVVSAFSAYLDESLTPGEPVPKMPMQLVELRLAGTTPIYEGEPLVRIDAVVKPGDVAYVTASWFKDGQPVVFDARHTQEQMEVAEWDGALLVSLRIADVALSDAGEYHCRLESDINMLTSPVLDVTILHTLLDETVVAFQHIEGRVPVASNAELVALYKRAELLFDSIANRMM